MGHGQQQLLLLIFIGSFCSCWLSSQAKNRTVTSAKELGEALLDQSMQVITIRGRVHLTKENWMLHNGGTAIIRPGRHVILQSDKDTPASAVLDLGTLVDAIHVSSGAHLELLRLHIPNSGNRKVKRPSERVRLNVAGAFALWPSVTVARDSKMSFGFCVFYYWSDEEWDSCDKFRDVATPILNPDELPDKLEWRASDTQVFMKGRHQTTHRLFNIVQRAAFEGTMRTERINHTLVCVPNIFRPEESDHLILVLVSTFVGTLLGAVGIAQYFGIFPLLAAAHGNRLEGGSDTSNSSKRLYGQQTSVDHITTLVRERQRATIDGLELGELLGRGSFGRVYRGRWRGALVAVKVVAHDCSIASLAETLRESALSTSIQHPNVVTTFKVRTVRAKREIESLASRWAQGSDNNLDDAAGDCHALLARAMSVSAARHVNGVGLERDQLPERCDSAIMPRGHLRSFSMEIARWPGFSRRMFWNRSSAPDGDRDNSPVTRPMRTAPVLGYGSSPVVVLDSEREAATALAHAKSLEKSPAKSAEQPAAEQPAPEQPAAYADDDDGSFNFMTPEDRVPAADGDRDEPLQEGAWMEGPDNEPTQIASLARRPQRGGGAAAAADSRIALADVCASDAPAQIAAALQAWHEAAGTRSPPPERSAHWHDSARGDLDGALSRSQVEMLETWLILEYCDHGSFDTAIRSGRYVNDLASGVLCLMDIAAGMEHLHSLGVLHADLKGGNVLLKSGAITNYDGRGYMCKLADFGLSRVMENNSTHVSTTTFGTAAYMPAEMLMEGRMTKAADVYSFGMLMWELVTGKKLFDGLRQSQIICKVMTGWRPPVPADCPESYRDIMINCWHANPAQRPGFAETLLRLRGLYRDLRTAALWRC